MSDCPYRQDFRRARPDRRPTPGLPLLFITWRWMNGGPVCRFGQEKERRYGDKNVVILLYCTTVLLVVRENQSSLTMTMLKKKMEVLPDWYSSTLYYSLKTGWRKRRRRAKKEKAIIHCSEGRTVLPWYHDLQFRKWPFDLLSEKDKNKRQTNKRKIIIITYLLSGDWRKTCWQYFC